MSELEVGTYVVKETKAPDGYIADNSSRIVEVKGNESATFVFTNTVKPSIKITKIDKHTGEKLEGAVVRIVNLSGNDVWEKTTDKNGEILLSGIDEGIYTVQEITAPRGLSAKRRALSCDRSRRKNKRTDNRKCENTELDYQEVRQPYR